MMARHLWFAAALWLCGMAAGWAACTPDHVDLRGEWGTARFAVEVADTPQARSRGLMHRQSMPTMAGMIFFYPAPQNVAFWMRNTLIPLDMIFADRRGVVRRVHANAVPLDETSIPGGPNIQSVLEINGGMAARLGIGPGTQLRHPGFAQGDAAWPCD